MLVELSVVEQRYHAAGPGLPLRCARRTPPGAVAGVREHPNPKETYELAFDTHKEENLRYRSQTLESVKHHLKPNRQRSVGPRQAATAAVSWPALSPAPPRPGPGCAEHAPPRTLAGRA